MSQLLHTRILYFVKTKFQVKYYYDHLPEPGE